MTTTAPIRLTPNLTSTLLDALRTRVAVPDGRPALPVVAPFTGEELATVPRAAPEDVAAAVQRSRVAQETW
ncbi:MAG: succinic semialdehyde dehydrogenase, partial [Acidimicrobiia bacterium]